MTYRDGNAYTEDIRAMAVGFDALAPVDGHLPLMFGSIVGADRKVRDFDRGIEALVFEKCAYMGHDFADEGGKSLVDPPCHVEVVIWKTEITTVCRSRSGSMVKRAKEVVGV